MGDGHPDLIEAVDTNRAAALKVLSPEETVGGVSPRAPVHVIAMHGHFTYEEGAPKGARAPHGTWATVTVDAKSGQVLDLSLEDRPPPVRRLGKIHSIALFGQAAPPR
jgi:hypothetical protein